MKHIVFFLVLGLFLFQGAGRAQSADPTTYLAAIVEDFNVQWPNNRTINLVFHGHSVPAGYWNDHRVETLSSYPHLLLNRLKAQYPYALINVIVTAKGGEHSVDGQNRFSEEVLAHRPDVLFIDYALNDIGNGLEKAKVAWEAMIQEALDAGIKVVLLTPSPDQRIDLADDSQNPLAQHAEQIRGLANRYQVALVDSYALFQEKVKDGVPLEDLMSWVNHPNRAGHQLIADAISSYFEAH